MSSNFTASLPGIGSSSSSSFHPSSIPVGGAQSEKKMSAFCGEYSNSTKIDVRLGVLGNECFLNGLSFVPNIIFVLIAVPVLISWNKSMFASMHVKTWVRFPHHTIRWLLFSVLLLTNMFEVVAGFLSDELLDGVHLHLYIPHIASVGGSVISIIYYHSVEMWNSPRFLLLLIPYWLALMVMEIMKTINLKLMDTKNESHKYMRPHFTRTSIVLYLLLLLIELDILRQLRYAFFKKRRILKPPESLAETNYVQSAVSLPSKATYFWVRSLVMQACKSPLELKDLGLLPKSERSGYNYSRLLAAIEEERDKQKSDEQVATSLWKSCWLKSQSMMLLAGLFMLIGSLFHLSAPLLLIYVLDFVENKATLTPTNGTLPLPKEGDMVKVSKFFSNGYVLSLFLFLSCILMNTFLQAGNYLVIREGVRIRGAIQLLMYSKILSLSLWNFTTRVFSISEIVSHISVDANNMLFCACIIHFIWLLPLKTILAVAILYGIIGWSAIIGGLAVLMLTLLQYLMATQLSNVQKEISEFADLRLKRCTEMLQNIKPLKLYSWEKVVSKRVEEVRLQQLRSMLKAAILKALTTFISEGGPIIVLMLAFTLYPYMEAEPLEARKVFPAILLFEIIGMPIQLLPILVNFIVHAQASTRKVAEFLGNAEIDNKRHHIQKPKFQKAAFQVGGDSGQSSQSATLDDGRSMNRRTTAVLGDQGHVSQPKHSKGFQNHSNSTEIVTQLSIIHEDKGEHKGGGADDKKGRKKSNTKTKNKKSSKDSHSLDGSETFKDKNGDVRGYEPEDCNQIAETSEDTKPGSSSYPVKKDSITSDKITTKSETDSRTHGPALLVLPSATPDLERDGQHAIVRPSSRRSSQQDIFSSGHKRTSSVISASNSVGSGLDDDDLIDPNRDVGIAVDIHAGFFAWEPEPTKALLSDVAFRADAGRLTVIVGSVGSGKSSLISAMLGEMTRLSGSITWKPGLTVCYSGSVPWILNASVQENILFGRPMEKKRYKRVLRACALQLDIDILPEKDMTEIGDKGISLSIGQRLRISIARAIYSKADLVVLDDPFSALDLPTASHIFEDGILHFCLMKRKRTVILVTHELHFLPFAHAIYQVDNGCLTYHGRLQDVKECNPELFAVWQDAVRQARRENQSRAEREDTTNTERLVLLRKIRTLEFRREVAQSVLDEEKKGDSPKRVFLSGQTTHITIEEEHPGGEDVKTSHQQPDEDEDFEQGMEMTPAKHEMNSLMKKKQQLLMMVDLKRGSAKPYEKEKPRVVVTCSALIMYARACCLPLTLLLFLFHLLRTSTLIVSDFWLAHWCIQGQSYLLNSGKNFSEMHPDPTSSDIFHIRIYALLTIGAILLCVIIAFCTELSGLRASKVLYFKMLRKVIVAPMKFFDTNPIARIMSRFSGDVTIIDDKLATTLEHFMRTLLLFLGSIVVNSIMSPYFLAPAAVILIAFIWQQRRFRSCYRELHKLDSITKAPLLSHCAETLTGLRTIRAFRDETRFWEEMEKLINVNNSTHLWLNTANRWIGIRLDYLASTLVLASAIAGIADNISSSLVALGITYALLISGYVNWAVRSIADVEVQMTAVQRIHEYSSLLPEYKKTEEKLSIGENWPASGEIIFHNVSILYSGNVVPVARNINIHIRSGEKVGICGRPGCGKSSLILSLFGMVEVCEGHIFIDGQKINNIPPSLLRSHLAVLPQDCMLISGTIRYNLDPEGVHSDDSLWETLDQVSLKDTIKYLSGQLDAVVTENGENFNISDKQLLCLARAVLKKSKVVIIDEVMSVLNTTTEKILHRILRTAFNDRTVINLSHRATSLMDYDTVVVLDNGLIVEHDTPQNLLAIEGGVFVSLLKKRPS